MAKDERGLHIQTPQEYQIQVEHMVADLGAGSGAHLSEDELRNLRPKLRIPGVIGGEPSGSTPS